MKGSNFLEGLNDLKYVVMDKTGTLTKGTFEITAIEPRNGINSGQLLELAAYAEAHSTHPIADSIKNTLEKKLERKITAYNEISGHGYSSRHWWKRSVSRNARLIEKFSVLIFRKYKKLERLFT